MCADVHPHTRVCIYSKFRKKMQVPTCLEPTESPCFCGVNCLRFLPIPCGLRWWGIPHIIGAHWQSSVAPMAPIALPPNSIHSFVRLWQKPAAYCVKLLPIAKLMFLPFQVNDWRMIWLIKGFYLKRSDQWEELKERWLVIVFRNISRGVKTSNPTLSWFGNHCSPSEDNIY